MFRGKIFMIVSMKLGACFAAYFNSVVEICTKNPLNTFASKRPITTATAVVQR